MNKHYRYYFELKHDGGTFFISVISWKKSNAVNMICEAERCPRSALTYIRKEPARL